MKSLAGVAATIAGAFQRFLAPVLRAIFGQIQWTPPAWMLRAIATLRSWGSRARDWLAARRAANPVRFWLETSAILAFILCGYAAWQWYEHLPEPYYLQVSVSRPGPMPLDVPNAVPDPVDLQFSGSAAKLGAIGKNVTSGITLTPPVPGVWRWVGDSLLIFIPRNQWPIGQDYTIKLDRKLFPSHVLLKEYSY